MLSDLFLEKKAFFEHHHFYFDEPIAKDELVYYSGEIYFKGIEKQEFSCFKIDENQKPITSYFIGVDWLNKKCNKSIYIQPKLNRNEEQLDYLQMLFLIIKNNVAQKYVDEIYEIKWEDKFIEININQDHLTPLLIVRFLIILKSIVQKGLKKTYYKSHKNLNGRIKGKVNISESIKRNLLKNKPLYTFCSFDEFGINGIENKLLKKALIFVQKYLSVNKLNTNASINNLICFINPAFENVSDDVSINEVKQSITNAFYKEYEGGIKFAKLILKRFGYNINNTQLKQVIKTPPFWIDMSKLFELYVLNVLKRKYNDEIIYQYGENYQETYYGQPDFILKRQGEEKIIDAKYKMLYQSEKIQINDYVIKDIRQLSAYARDNKIINTLNNLNSSVIECVIIYPHKLGLIKKEEPEIKFHEKEQIYQFNGFYKVPIKLPLIENI